MPRGICIYILPFDNKNLKAICTQILKDIIELLKCLSLEPRVCCWSGECETMARHSNQVCAKDLALAARRLSGGDPWGLLVLADCDLYPVSSWTACFGVTFIEIKTVVVSTKHFSDNPGGAGATATVLKTVLHEMGHLFGLQHCLHLCRMQRCVSVADVQASPCGLCRSCEQKLSLQTAVDWPGLGNLLSDSPP
eukprot:Platyproteum_vivax@DN4830_c0_g1_i1.p1